MKKPTFLTYEKPLLTAMVQCATPDEAICMILNSIADGAEAFGIQLESLKREYRDEDTLRTIFAACGNRPIYITSYRNAESEGMSDDECADLLLRGLKCGATLCDVIGDLYSPAKYQITDDPAAIAKQRALIDKIHEMGGEVLISSHVCVFMSVEEVLEIARKQREHGTDIVKIVCMADDDAELITNLEIITKLRAELDCPFLYLAGGSQSKIVRQVGPILGSCMYLCVHEYTPSNTHVQPKITAAKAVRDILL